jgi:hypothetical protein
MDWPHTREKAIFAAHRTAHRYRQDIIVVTTDRPHISFLCRR